jgi:AcrR family transcriptional regulator
MANAHPVPRGRHAPPREVREELQRERLLEAAAHVFSRTGYADASAEAISREAGMSKATFYEHFGNKRECLLGLMDHASAVTITVLIESARAERDDAIGRHLAGMRSLLDVVDEQPDLARAALIESVGAGPEAMVRRDALIQGFAQVMFDETMMGVTKYGGGPRFEVVDDAVAVIGAILELIGRHLRTSRPERVQDIAPIAERLLRGMLTDPDA